MLRMEMSAGPRFAGSGPVILLALFPGEEGMAGERRKKGVTAGLSLAWPLAGLAGAWLRHGDLPRWLAAEKRKA